MSRLSTRGRRTLFGIAGAIAILGLCATLALAAPGDPPGAVTGLVSSTHTSETTWYRSANPAFTWNPTLATGAAVAGYSFALDQNPATVPDLSSERVSLDYLPRVTYATGSAPFEDHVADFNGDGKLDLVVENDTSNTISILLGNGDGTFRAKVDYPTNTGPWSMDVGDLNGDNHPDIVVDDRTASKASVFINKGDGTFNTKVDFTTGTNPESLKVGDVNNDGKLDIVTANSGSNNVSVLTGKGDGTFNTKSDFGTGGGPTSIDMGDLNGDGKLDLVAANATTNAVSVLTGKGDGTFNAKVDYATGGSPYTVVVADVSRDGKPDVATVNYAANTASVLINTGTGTLKPKVDYAVGGGPYALAVRDLNSDGAPDIVTTNHTANTASILFGNGDGTFNAKIDRATGGGPFWVALGDFTGDGYGDLAVTDQSDNNVSVYVGTAYLATSFNGVADGAWYFHVRAIDTLGQGGTTSTRIVRIDATAPTTTQSGADTGWHNGAVTVILSPTDASSGVAGTQYKVDSGGWTTGTSLTVPAPLDGTNDGAHTVSYRSTDVAGNVETAKTCSVNIVTSAPTTTVSGADGAWHAGGVTLGFASSSYGVNATQYRIDGGTWVTGTSVTIPAPADGSNDGAHTVEYRSSNGAGYVEDAKSVTVKIDAAAPVTTVSGVDGAWHGSDVTLHLTGSDAGSGVAATEYRIDGGGWVGGTTVTVAAPANGSNDGIHTVEYRSTDVYGHVETARSASVKIDAATPVTTVSGNDSAWHSSDVTLHLSGSDGGSGVATTEYRIDGGAWTSGTTVSVPAPANGSNDGVHTVEYRSTDVAGNGETAKSCSVKIVTIAPTTAVSGSDGAWHASQVTLDFSSTSAGVVATEYSVDGGPWTSGASVVVPAPANGSNDGIHTVSYRSTNALGQVEVAKTCSVKIDVGAPTTTVSGVDSAWHAADVSLTLSGSDSGSGVATTEYRIDGGSWVSGTTLTVPAPANGSDDGAHTVEYRSTDVAGHVEPAQSCTVRIDTTAPVTTASGADSAWHAADVSVTLSGADAGSGVTSTEYRVDGGGWVGGTTVTVPAPANGSNDGAHTVEYRSTDASGKTETPGSVAVRIDTTAPETVVSGSDDAWHDSDVVLGFSATDVGSGGAWTEYRVDGGDWSTGDALTIAAPPDGSDDGAHVVEYRAHDAAGNREAAKSVTVRIDTVAPVTSDDSGDPLAWHAVPFAVHLTPVDAGSVARTEYRVGDTGPWVDGLAIDFTKRWKRAGGSGPVTIFYRSIDAAGHTETPRTCVVNINTSLPTTTSDAPSGPQTGDVTVHLTGSDPYSGISQTWYSLDGGAWQMGATVFVAAPADHSNDGVHTIAFSSIDGVGNAECGYKVCRVLIQTP